MNKGVSFLMLVIMSTGTLAKTPYRVLSTDSYIGKGALSQLLKEQFEKQNPETELVFVTTKQNAGLWGRLLSDSKRKRPLDYDAVLGLEERFFLLGKGKKMLSDGGAFERSPMTILINTKSYSEKKLPKSWSELAKKIKKQLLVQDPRLSTPGFAWLSAIYEHKLISKEEASAVVYKTLPSWSASYELFQKGEAPMVWTYLSSLAYHRCNDKEHSQYKNLELKEGYPLQRNFLAQPTLAPEKNRQTFTKLQDLLLSSEIQSALPELTWMFPENSKQVPKCFEGLNSTQGLASKSTSENEVQKWIDDWSL